MCLELMNINVKLEEEIDVLRSSLTKVNKRVGVEEVVGSSDDSTLSDEIILGSPEANTRYDQVDCFFASEYYYITNVKLIYIAFDFQNL